MTAAAAAPPERLMARPDFRAVMLTIVVTGAGQTFYFAIMPPLGRELTFSELQIGAVISFASLAYVFAAPIWGRLSDFWGRRPIILFGLICYVLFTTLIGAVAQAGLAGFLSAGAAFGLMVLFRVLFATTAASMFPVIFAYVADKTSRATRTHGYAILGAAMGLGTIIGPAAAAFLGRISLILPFYVAAGLVVGVLVLVWRTIDRTKPDKVANAGRRFFIRPPARMFPLLLIGAMIYATLAAMQQATGFRVQDTQALDAADTATFVGIALAVSSVLAVSMQAGLIQWLKWPPKRLLVVGAIAALAGGLLLAVTESYPLIVVGVGSLGAAFGMMNPAYTAALTLSAEPGEQGAVLGLNGTVQGLGFTIGPLIGGGLYQVAPTLPYWCIAGFAVVSLTASLLTRVPDTSAS
jgi:DHA1 family multidrug resistance protein-like MFS transporter